MKKFIFIAIIVGVVAGISVLLYQIIPSKNNVGDTIKMEDSIIVHGIQMDSDTPPYEGDDESEGKIIYDDTFDDAIIDYDQVKKQKGAGRLSKAEMKEFDALKAKDKRWHLKRYQIKRKDNLWRIAKRFGVHQHVIISINGITNPDMLKPGKCINIPTKMGIYYQVKKGDTVSNIAKCYRINAKSIIAQNRIRVKSIRLGQKIFLPDAREMSLSLPVAAVKKNRQPMKIAYELKDFIWPMRGKITSGFGNRLDPLSGQRRFHCGIDISANVGTPIKAAGDGRVIFAGWKPGYGNVVIIRHDGGYISVYAHNSKNLADLDSSVNKGDLIAYSGMTGAVTGAHLHFEIRKYVNPLNPLRLIR